jgi:hypothetical protein
LRVLVLTLVMGLCLLAAIVATERHNG